MTAPPDTILTVEEFRVTTNKSGGITIVVRTTDETVVDVVFSKPKSKSLLTYIRAWIYREDQL